MITYIRYTVHQNVALGNMDAVKYSFSRCLSRKNREGGLLEVDGREDEYLPAWEVISPGWEEVRETDRIAKGFQMLTTFKGVQNASRSGSWLEEASSFLEQVPR